MADPLGPVTIGAREIYDAVVGLTATVGELRGELARQRDAQAVQAAQLAEQRHDTDRRLAGYSGRLRSVERRTWAMPSASLVISALAVVVAVVALV